MTTDVEVTVTGLPFDQKAVSGVSISYGYNSIPVASVQLVAPYIEEEAKSFLCDPDSFKKQTRDSNVTIKIKSKTGCIKFDGVFDGLSFSQSPGGFSYAAIIKSKFQCMLELYPKFIGIDPTSALPFKRIVTGAYDFSKGDDPYLAFEAVVKNVQAGGLTLVEYYIELIKVMIDTQAALVSNGPDSTFPILEMLRDKRSKDNIERCRKLLTTVNLDFVKKINVMGGKCGAYLADQVIASEDTLWDTLMSSLDDMGCMLLPGNNKLFIIPKANYLKQTGLSAPGFQEQATSPNIAYPSDFVSFSINDVSYRNIRACYVLPTILDSNALIHDYKSQDLGSFPSASGASDIQDDGSAGFLIVPAPQFIIKNLDGLYTRNDEVQQGLKDKYAGDVVDDPDTVKDKYKSHIDEFKGDNVAIKPTMDRYAKSRFLQEKYSERGGTLILNVLKPNWVPGTTGSVYTRHPGLFYSFFVNNVTHSVVLGNGNSGSATTTISFNSCRYAGNGSKVPGTNSADLYQYSSGDMASVQQTWLSDVGANTIEDSNTD